MSKGHGVRSGLVACVVACVVAMGVTCAIASQPDIEPAGEPIASNDATDAPVQATAARGITGELIFEYAGPALRAKPNQSLVSPMLVRLTPETEPSRDGAGKSVKYRLNFNGGVAGIFDLREYVEQVDGRAPTDLPPLRVSIVSQLPERHGTDLFESDHQGVRMVGRYRDALIGIGVLWILVPVAVIARRLMKRKSVEAVEIATPAPTLADQLKPLVEAAVGGGMSVADQGRLELLLIWFWSERLGLQSLSPADAIGRIRADATAGKLLVTIERWLHGRGGANISKEELAALLEPYRSIAAVDLNMVRGADARAEVNA